MSIETVEGEAVPFPSLVGERFVSLTTFRRTGEGVSTPVTPLRRGSRFFFLTAESTGKAKRLRSNPRITLAPSDARGTVLGPAMEGLVTPLAGAEAEIIAAAFLEEWAPLGIFERMRVMFGELSYNYYEVVPLESEGEG